MTPLVLLGNLAACGESGQGSDPPVIVTATDDAGEAGDDGADESGGGPFPTSTCLMENTPNRFGYKYQCGGNITIEAVIEGDFPDSPATNSLELVFGPGVEGDSYETPHVMACCPEYDTTIPNCEQEHEQYCIADLVEQGCKSMEPNLRDFADEAFSSASFEDTIKRGAINKIADHVRDHQVDCLNTFVTDTGVGTIPPGCDMDGNGIRYGELLQTGVWSFDPDGLVTNVRITVSEANWTGLFPLDGTPDQCNSADDNDGVLFLELDPEPGSTIVFLVMGSASVHGPPLGDEKIEGIAMLSSEVSGCQPGSCSSMRVLIDDLTGMGSLESFEAHSAAPVEVGTSDDALAVDDFQVRLWDSTPAVFDPQTDTLTIPPGAARYAISADAEGIHRAITATNETTLVLTRELDGWTSSELTIGYDDELGSHWTLVLAPAQWH